MLVELKDS